MKVLVCVKRVPMTGGRIVLTADERAIDTRFLGSAVSPHEECAVEEAVRVVEAHGGESVVLTLGPSEAEEQLRDAMALGIDRAILLETDGRELDPGETASAIAQAVSSQPFDLMLFGNEAADTGDYQVGVRVAHALGLPCVTGAKELEIGDGRAAVRREAGAGWEVFEVPLPAVVAVREGINLPRYPSVPGRLRAKGKPVERSQVAGSGAGLEMIRLALPEDRGKEVRVLGRGPEAAAAVIDLLRDLGMV